MSKRFIELENRVFSVRIEPHGECEGSVVVEIESGAPWTAEEAEALVARCIAEAVKLGIPVTGWHIGD